MASARAIERWAVRLIAVHSALVGIALLVAPARLFAVFGWPVVEPVFFARQAGVFHGVVAVGYWLEYRRSGGITLLVTAKATAFVFLTLVWALGESAWLVPVSGVADGVLGIVAAWLHRRATTGAAARTSG